MGGTPHSWQLVTICWGTKYGADDINRLYRAARRHSPDLMRMVVVTDRARAGLDTGIEQADFPEYFLRDALRGPGCQAKLGMFEEGVLNADLPAVYVDLDSVILGDLGAISQSYAAHEVAVLQSTILPASAFTRWLFKVTDKKRYTRGNSSIVVFHPRETTDIAPTFRELFDAHGLSFKPTRADERFISWVAQPRLRFVPARRAVKFTREFMSHSLVLLRLKAMLPWTEARRQGLLFVTFNQDVIKPSELKTTPEGQVIEDRKGRKTGWDRRYLGGMLDVFVAYFDR